MSMVRTFMSQAGMSRFVAKQRQQAASKQVGSDSAAEESGVKGGGDRKHLTSWSPNRHYIYFKPMEG